MLTDTAEYALRSVLYLARESGGRAVPAAKVAEGLDLPPNYLSKILYRLARRGVLESARGPHGGFSLAEPAGELSLARVVDPFFQIEESGECLLRNRECGEDDTCAAHDRWTSLTEEIQGFFRETTVEDLLHEPERDAAAPSDTRTHESPA